jgi:hypothetical protein|tara:strand:- start:1626 stop:1835 length:210 start_codon:yes stop_codon:yes gene_type:complete
MNEFKIENISEEQYNHYFQKWLYQYGGASDYVSLKHYIENYNNDVEGDVDIYSTSLCPCIICIKESQDE